MSRVIKIGSGYKLGQGLRLGQLEDYAGENESNAKKIGVAERKVTLTGGSGADRWVP